MSPNMTSHKLLPIFTSYFWPALMALLMAFFLSQWAVADPPAESNAPAATTDKVLPLEADTPEQLATDDKADSVADQLKTTPAVNTVSSAPTKLSEKCYEQTDGSFECVCEGKEECKTLEKAEHCEAGTHWGKDGYGGCTKRAVK